MTYSSLWKSLLGQAFIKVIKIVLLIEIFHKFNSFHPGTKKTFTQKLFHFIFDNN